MGYLTKKMLKINHICVAYPNKALLMTIDDKIMRAPFTHVTNSHKVLGEKKGKPCIKH